MPNPQSSRFDVERARRDRVKNEAPKFKKQCGARKTQGWGGMSYCLFDKGHNGPCSWGSK